MVAFKRGLQRLRLSRLRYGLQSVYSNSQPKDTADRGFDDEFLRLQKSEKSKVVSVGGAIILVALSGLLSTIKGNHYEIKVYTFFSLVT